MTLTFHRTLGPLLQHSELQLINLKMEEKVKSLRVVGRIKRGKTKQEPVGGDVPPHPLVYSQELQEEGPPIPRATTTSFRLSRWIHLALPPSPRHPRTGPDDRLKVSPARQHRTRPVGPYGSNSCSRNSIRKRQDGLARERWCQARLGHSSLALADALSSPCWINVSGKRWA